MPGGRDSFPSKIIADFIKRSLQFQFAGVEQHQWDCEMALNYTIYSMETHCDTRTLTAPFTEPKVSLLQAIATMPKTQRLACRIPAGLASGGDMSQLKTRIHSVETWRILGLKWHQVTFEPFLRPRIRAMQVTKTAPPKIKPVVCSEIKTGCKAVPIPQSRTRAKAMSFEKLRVKVAEVPSRCYALPIIKNAVPLSRFNARQMMAIQKALADKAGISPVSIKVTLVYDRMYMPLFTSLSQDKQGRIVCVPKSDHIGKNHSAWEPFSSGLSLGKTAAATTDNKPLIFYLVFGMRSDTQQQVRALVPLAVLEEEA